MARCFVASMSSHAAAKMNGGPLAVRVHKLPSVVPASVDPLAHHVHPGDGGGGGGGFINPWPSYQPTHRRAFLSMRYGRHPEKNFVPVPKGDNGARSTELVAVRKPTWGFESPSSLLRATWIGHASFLTETPALPSSADHENSTDNHGRGIRFLFDPLWSERTSPVTWFGPKRYTQPPCPLDDIPDVDIVCISHNHYDHLDLATVRAILKRRGRHVVFFVPLGVKAWFDANLSTAPGQVIELDWWEQRRVNTTTSNGTKDDALDSDSNDEDRSPSVTLTCVPAQHGSRRGLFDHDRTLWCGWTVTTPTRRFYFAGDTAYQAPETPSACPVFAQIGAALGPFDLAAVPIGLCTPATLMGGVHAAPEQSLDIHRDVRSKLSIGMHYGTVRGGVSSQFEDVRDPPRRWRVAAEAAGLWCGGGVEGGGTSVDVSKEGVGLCDVGETVAV